MTSWNYKDDFFCNDLINFSGYLQLGSAPVRNINNGFNVEQLLIAIAVTCNFPALRHKSTKACARFKGCWLSLDCILLHLYWAWWLCQHYACQQITALCFWCFIICYLLVEPYLFIQVVQTWVIWINDQHQRQYSISAVVLLCLFASPHLKLHPRDGTSSCPSSSHNNTIPLHVPLLPLLGSRRCFPLQSAQRYRSLSFSLLSRCSIGRCHPLSQLCSHIQIL